jgi:hypothetical protein
MKCFPIAPACAVLALVALTEKTNNDTINNLNAVGDVYRKVKENLNLAEETLGNYSPIATDATRVDLQKQVRTFRGLLDQAQNAKVPAHLVGPDAS